MLGAAGVVSTMREFNATPHFPQNLRPSVTDAPQFGQNIEFLALLSHRRAIVDKVATVSD
jgi:hypothetical protein